MSVLQSTVPSLNTTLHILKYSKYVSYWLLFDQAKDFYSFSSSSASHKTPVVILVHMHVRKWSKRLITNKIPRHNIRTPGMDVVPQVWDMDVIPQVWGMDVIPQVWGMDVIPQVWGMDVIPQVWGMDVIPQVWDMDVIPQVWGMDVIPQVWGMGVIPQFLGVDVILQI